MAVLEIIAFNVESAKAAELSGADRLELCENSAVGGTTPSYGFIKFCQEKISIPCFPMIRPRGGNFFYNTEEIGVIKADTIMCRELGCPGIVTGMLSPDGQIDTQTLKEIISLAGTMQVTFHRAFDRCIDPFKALEDIIHAGCTRMLSSGQAATAMEGAMLLKELQEQAGDRIIIMPGSGVRSSTVKELAHDHPGAGVS